MYDQGMYWLIEYIQESNLEKKEWKIIVEEAWNKYIRALTILNKPTLK